MAEQGREALLSFIDSYVSSFEAWDILAYLAVYPEALLSLESMARDLGRRPEDLAAAATRLEGSGVLLQAGAGRWRLSSDSQLRASLQGFAEAIDDHKQRLFVLTRLLENLSR